jgi:hypothetical protein
MSIAFFSGVSPGSKGQIGYALGDQRLAGISKWEGDGIRGRRVFARKSKPPGRSPQCTIAKSGPGSLWVRIAVMAIVFGMGAYSKSAQSLRGFCAIHAFYLAVATMLMAVHGNRYRQFLLEHGSVQGMLLTELEGPAARVLRTIRESTEEAGRLPARFSKSASLRSIRQSSRRPISTMVRPPHMSTATVAEAPSLWVPSLDRPTRRRKPSRASAPISSSVFLRI